MQPNYFLRGVDQSNCLNSPLMWYERGRTEACVWLAALGEEAGGGGGGGPSEA